MQRLSRLVDKVCLLEPEDPETFSPLEKKIRKGLGLSFRGLVAVFFAWHVFDFLFSAIWMHGYVWSLNLPIDLDLSDKSAGSIVYHQKNVVGAFERVYHAFGAAVGIFLIMMLVKYDPNFYKFSCSGFASGKDKKVWELVKLATAFGFLVATVRGCQIKHRLFSALHEGFYTMFLVFFVGVILALQSATLIKENTQSETVEKEEKKTN